MFLNVKNTQSKLGQNRQDSNALEYSIHVSVTNQFSLILDNFVNLLPFLLIFRHDKQIFTTQSYTVFCYVIFNAKSLYIILQFAGIMVVAPGMQLIVSYLMSISISCVKQCVLTGRALSTSTHLSLCSLSSGFSLEIIFSHRFFHTACNINSKM